METLVKQENRKLFNFKDFSQLDTSQDARYLIDSMDELYELECIQLIKQRAINLLEVKPGEHILELGCGLGHDAEAFGKLVGTTGYVAAIDSSQLMIDEARKRTQYSHVDYILANANRLNFNDNSFDKCHMDRLLVSQNSVKQVLKESIRVLKPGGKLCITDCDFGSIVFYPYHSTTPVLIKRLQSIVENPFIGRDLAPFFQELGLVDIHIQPEPYVLRSLAKLNTMIDIPRILEDLYFDGQLSQEDVSIMLKDLWKADNQSLFMYGITLMTVVGTKP